MEHIERAMLMVGHFCLGPVHFVPSSMHVDAAIHGLTTEARSGVSSPQQCGMKLEAAGVNFLLILSPSAK